MTQRVKDWLYMLHALIVWGGGSWQILHVYSHRSAEDITLVWVTCLLLSELVALPRAFDSPFWVWKLCHVVSTILIGILLVGIVLYG